MPASRTSPAPLAERLVSTPPTSRAAALQPSSWNAEQRTIDVVWTTGSRGVKFLWDACSLVDEELATGSANVRLDRLNGGAPVLDTHQRFDLGGQIGVVVPGSARMARGQGTATVQLSDRPDLAPIVADIAAGIIRNLSVGYTVHAYEIEQREGQRPLYRAVDWEPFEISFVPVPFDAAAQVRSGPELHPCILRTVNLETRTMSRRANARSAGPALPSQDENEAEAATSSRAGVSTTSNSDLPASIAQLREYISMGCRDLGIREDQQSSLVLELAERGVSMPEARRELTAILMERQANATRGAFGGPVAFDIVGNERTFDNPAFHARAIEDALYSRMSGTAPSEAAREFRGMTMVQLAGEMLMRAGARDIQRMAPNDVLNAAAWNTSGTRSAMSLGLNLRMGPGHTTSDFPDLLTASGNRYLLDQFAAAATVIKLVSRERSANDFREISGLQLSAFGTLPEVLEDGEIKAGTFASRK